MKRIALFGIALMAIATICGCANTTAEPAPTLEESLPSERELYQNLTKSDKLFYNDLLLHVVNKFDNPGSVRVDSIRNNEKVTEVPFYWAALKSDESSEDRFYGYILIDGAGTFAPVSFEKDPMAWDFAEESKFDVEGINATLAAREREFANLRTSSPIDMGGICDALEKCRTFYYNGGDIYQEHSITRVDLENGNFEFITFTGVGTKGADRVREVESNGTYLVDIEPDGTAFLVLDNQERCMIQFDENNNISGILATGYSDFEGDVELIELRLTDSW